MSKQARAIIKELAMQAKMRMKNKEYGTREENLNLKRKDDRNYELKQLSNYECRKPEITIKIINDSVDDENFKNRVYALLQQNEDTFSPLKELTNKSEFKNFTEEEQEKYILDLAEKYNKVRESYYKQSAL